MVGMIIIGVLEIAVGVYIYADNQYFFEYKDGAILWLLFIVIIMASKSFCLAYAMNKAAKNEKKIAEASGVVRGMRDRIRFEQGNDYRAANPGANLQPQNHQMPYGNSARSEEHSAATPVEKKEPTMYCPQCGAKQTGNENQCRQCGYLF